MTSEEQVQYDKSGDPGDKHSILMCATGKPSCDWRIVFDSLQASFDGLQKMFDRDITAAAMRDYDEKQQRGHVILNHNGDLVELQDGRQGAITEARWS